ncbi:pyruvate kinase [soil metagenome]
MRASKLVCTIGPASVDRVAELVAAGMDVARLNFSHGTDAGHRRVAAAALDAAADEGRTVAILADLPGPKVRLGELAGGSITLRTGGRFLLFSDAGPTDRSVASTNHPGLGADLREGDRLLLADGEVELLVARPGEPVDTEVIRGGTVRSGAGVSIPAERLSLPAITERDRQALEVALGFGADLIAQSFVRGAADVAALRALVGHRRALLVAKIETRAAVDDFDAILAEADAVMVARGDLGVAMPFEEIPLAQKGMIARAVARGRPIIVATQMLESMTSHPRPTRAEASDVATAVLDGADAVMLSAESAIGRFPIEAATAAARIASYAEARGGPYETRFDRERDAPLSHEHRDASGEEDTAWALATAAADLADRHPDVSALVVYTASGRSAELVASARPDKPIYAFSHDAVVVRRLALRRGVTPLAMDEPADIDSCMASMASRLATMGAVPAGSSLVVIAASPIGHGPANILRVHRMPD